MGFFKRTFRFGGGLALGAAVSTAVSVLLAPQSGPELQGELQDRREEALRAGEEAEILEEERLKRQYRVAVNDPTALTGKFDRPGAPTQI
ncbi:MAG: YtxH domain-containing protein, partial [Chloroflexota bacterium]|nr:YtxH domain-containing protein [Chloroflexota bacterium]